MVLLVPVVRLTMHGPMKAWFAAKQKKKNCAEKAFKKYVGSQILWRILQPFTIEDCTDNSIFLTQDMQCCWLFKNARTSHILGWKYRIIYRICYGTRLQYSSQYLDLRLFTNYMYPGKVEPPKRLTFLAPLYIPHTTNIGPPMVVFRTSVPQERTKNAIKNRFAKKSW